METKDIIGYEGLYKVNTQGDVYNSKGLKLKPVRGSSGTGYFAVSLCKNGYIKSFMVHRLVAIHFIPNPKNKKTVNHKDGNKTNNNLSNLEWMTYSENQEHSIKVLGAPKPPKIWLGKTGSKHNRSKKVYEFDSVGVLIGEYESGLDFQRKTGVHHSSVSWSIKKKKSIFGKYYSRSKTFKDIKHL